MNVPYLEKTDTQLFYGNFEALMYMIRQKYCMLYLKKFERFEFDSNNR